MRWPRLSDGDGRMVTVGQGATATVVHVSREAAVAAPEATRAMARTCMLDWFGLAIAGMAEPVAALLLDSARAEGAAPAATVLSLIHI